MMLENTPVIAIGIGNLVILIGLFAKIWGWTTKVELRITVLEQRVEIYNERLKDLLKQITVYKLYLGKDEK